MRFRIGLDLVNAKLPDRLLGSAQVPLSVHVKTCAKLVASRLILMKKPSASEPTNSGAVLAIMCSGNRSPIAAILIW